MPKFNKTFYKKHIIKNFGDNPTSRKMMMVLDLSLSENQYVTWREFTKIYA